MSDQLLTLAEVAKILRLSVRTVQEKARLGEIKSVRLGHRTVRIYQSALKEYINANS